MVKKTKGKHRLDKYYHLAKEQGYRSRAAFKLVQLNRQFHFLDKARACLDLCAAPGGWMQVAVKTMPLNSLIIGIDLDPIRPIKGARSILGDITTAKARAAIKKEANGGLMEVVLHDGAPNVGGVWASEAYSQSALVLEALRLATDVLVPDGAFVTKIFRSQDYNALLFAFNQLFRRVEATKPAASRNTSAEIFVVCQGYKAPAKIDPRLLDPRHLFKEVAEAPKSMGPDALLKQKVKQKRFREGYEEGLSSTHREASAAAFIQSENPVEMLGQYTRFILEEGNAMQPVEAAGAAPELTAFLKAHPATDSEIRALLQDLQVLGRSEFKQLLKWRLKVKRDFAATAPKRTTDDGEEAEGSGDEEKDKEIALLEEMQEVKEQASRRERREKKRKLKLKKKSRVRSAQLAMAEGIGEEGGNEGLFTLTAIQGPSRAGDLDEAEAPGEDAAASSEEEADDLPESDIDSDEEDRRYEASMEAYLEEAYQQYKARKGKQAEVQRAKRARLGLPADIASDEEADEDASPREPLSVPEFQEDPEIGGGLLVDLEPAKKPPKSVATVTAKWFSQDLFDGAEEDGEGEGGATESQAARVPAKSLAGTSKLLVPQKSPRPAAEKGVGVATGAAAAADAADNSFEEVPADSPASESSSDTELEEPDENTAAELRAMAKAMLSGRRKSDIVEGAYNRYAFHDDHLPPWFADDQRRHMRPPEVLSRDEIEAEKQRNKAIDTRPIKKVAEAKARKKKRLQARLEQAKKKAGAILEQGDLSERAKAKEVEKLYAKAKAGGKGKKKKPSRSDQYKKKGPRLDRRLLSDKRQVDNKAKKRASKKKGGKAKGKGRR